MHPSCPNTSCGRRHCSSRPLAHLCGSLCRRWIICACRLHHAEVPSPLDPVFMSVINRDNRIFDRHLLISSDTCRHSSTINTSSHFGMTSHTREDWSLLHSVIRSQAASTRGRAQWKKRREATQELNR